MQSLWMLFAAFVFSLMGACIKLASSLYSTSEIVMYRGGIGMVLMSAVIIYSRDTFKTPFPWHHLWRGILGVTAMWMWFFSISKLPLATGMTLNYMSSIWIAAILCAGALWHRKRQREWGMVAAIAMSFVGVVLLLRPTFHADQWFAGMVALASGILSALAYLQVRQLGQFGETEARVVFYLSTVGTVTGFLGTLYGGSRVSSNLHGWHAHGGKGIALILVIGICASVAQVAMTRAYRLGNTLVTANLQYTGILFSSAWGVLLWGDILNLSAWLGIAIILASGIAATYYNVRNLNAARGDTQLSEIKTDPVASEI
jgi:S-adenosylmethionine uptake transporter